MMNNRPINFITFLILALCAIKQILGNTDTALYLRSGDIYKLDLLSKTSTFSNSLNFSSNNSRITLPGLVDKNKEPKIQTELSFNPAAFKYANRYFFDLEKNGRVFRRFTLDADYQYNELDSVLSEQLQKRENMHCLDMVIGNLKNYYVLCIDVNEQTEEKSKFIILAINVETDNLLFTIPISTSPIIKPKIKILSENNEGEHNHNIMLLIFDKNEAKKDKNISNQNSYIIPILKNNSSDYKLSVIININLNQLLFSGKTNNLQVHNIMIDKTSKNPTMIFWISSANKSQHVYSCVFKPNDSYSSGNIDNCKLFILEEVTDFFYKNGNYVYITPEKNMIFGSKKYQGIKKGKIQNNWTVKSILFNDDKAIVIMEIGNIMVYFFNNYKEGTFSYYNEQKVNATALYLFSYNIDGKIIDKLIYFYNKGFQLRDISFNSYLIVKGGDVEDGKRVQIKLDDQLITNLKLKQWDEKQIVNLYKNRFNNIVRNSKGEFKSRLGYSGKSLTFETDSKATVLYFNDIEMYKYNNPDTINKSMRYFSIEGNLYRIYDNEITLIKCTDDKIITALNCTQELIVSSEIEIPVDSIDQISEFGNSIILKFKAKRDLILVNLAKKKVEKYKLNDDNISNCKVELNYYFCYKQKVISTETSMDVIVAYKIENGIRKVENFTEDYISRLQTTLAEYHTTSYKNIEIVSFDRSYTNSHKLIVLLSIVNKDNTTKSMGISINFYQNMQAQIGIQITSINIINKEIDYTDLKESTKLFLFDSQIVLLNQDPAFKLICYDGDSIYNLEYLNTRNIIQTLVYKPLNIMGLLYKEIESDETYFALYKIIPNAVKQFIGNFMLKKYDEKSQISFFIYKATQIGVLHYNSLTGQIIDSKMYYAEGPLFYGSSEQTAIEVNGETKTLEFKEDAIFNINEFRYIKNIINVEADANIAFDLSEYIEFTGNLVDIRVDRDKDDEKDVEKMIQIHKPLSFEKETTIYEPPHSYIDKSQIVYTPLNSGVIYQKQDLKSYVFQKNSDKSLKKLEIEFLNTNDNYCIEVFSSKQHIFCYWVDNAQAFLTYKKFENLKQEEQIIEIARPGKNFNVLEDNANDLLFIHEDIHNRYIDINRYDRTKKLWVRKKIGKRLLEVPDLFITDYHFSESIQKNKLTILIYDQVSNNILLYHADVATLTPLDFLQKSTNLNHLSFSFNSFKCQDIDGDDFNFECTLFGDIDFFRLSIKLDPIENSASYTWSVRVIENFKNGLFENTFDENYKLKSIENKNYLFIADANPNIIKRSIYMYVKNKQSQFTRYMLPASDSQYIKEMAIVDDKYLQLYVVKDSKLSLVSYSINDYRIILNNVESLIGKSIDFTAHFNIGPLNFKLYVRNPEEKRDKVINPIKKAIIILIVFILIVILLILSLIVFILVLLRERKKIRERSTMMFNETILKENDQESSFRVSKYY